MTTTKNPQSPSSTRFATRGLKIFSIGILSMASLACNAGLELRPKAPSFEAQAEFGGVATAEAVATTTSEPTSYAEGAEPAPSAGRYAQSGGGSAETAEPTSSGSTVAGRVAKGAPRYYAIDLAVGDALSFKVYGSILSGSYSKLEASLTEPDMVDLGAATLFLSDGPEKTERESFAVTAVQPGRHYIKVTSDRHPIEYRIEITSENQAAR